MKQLRSPIMVASGPWGVEGAKHVGAVVTKTLTLNPCKGNPEPWIFEQGDVYLNRVGLANPGLVEALTELDRNRPDHHVVVSVFIPDPDEALGVARILERGPHRNIELNVSCPNTHLAPSSNEMYDIIRVLQVIPDLHVSVKLPTQRPVDWAQVAQAAGAESVVACNSHPSLLPRDGDLIDGGLSGPGILPLSLHLAHTVVEAVHIPVIGCGGVTSLEAARAYLRVGCSAVQVGSAHLSDPEAASKIARALPGPVIPRLLRPYI